jgi:hypothetical protein
MIKILCQEITKLDACFLRLGSRFTEAKQNIKLLKEENAALHNLVKEQDKKIVELAFRVVYVERSNEVKKELIK